MRKTDRRFTAKLDLQVVLPAFRQLFVEVRHAHRGPKIARYLVKSKQTKLG